jgi:hypothetical protein
MYHADPKGSRSMLFIAWCQHAPPRGVVVPFCLLRRACFWMAYRLESSCTFSSRTSSSSYCAALVFCDSFRVAEFLAVQAALLATMLYIERAFLTFFTCEEADIDAATGKKERAYVATYSTLLWCLLLCEGDFHASSLWYI